MKTKKGLTKIALNSIFHATVRYLLCFLACIILSNGSFYAAFAGTGSELSMKPKIKASRKENELLVKFKEKTSDADKTKIHQKHASKVLRDFKSLRIHHIKLKKGITIEEAIQFYAKEPDVEYAEPNYVVSKALVPNDANMQNLWGLDNNGQTGGMPDADIDAPEAWNITTGSANVVIAVVDTGIDYNHGDLYGNVWVNEAESYGLPGVDDDGNGYVDDIHGIDAYNHDGDPFDDHSHGTHVAGTIGATGNNGIGVVGVNWSVRLMACKFLDASGSGDTAGAIECLQYIKMMKDRGVNIVATNNSWGGGGYSQALSDAIVAQRDILFVAAAGNNNLDTDETPFYPANYKLLNLVSVAATDQNDNKASFSNFGKNSVHVAAPGDGILSTVPNNWYASYSGTSMATPHVTGLAALLKSQDPARDWRQLKNLLLTGGDSIPALADITQTGRRINAYGSLTCADNSLFAIIESPTAPAVGVPATLSARSIRCAAPVAPVTVTLSDSTVISLHDDGIAPDLVEGDGVFSGEWIPSGGAVELLTFTSPVGSKTVAAPPVSIADQVTVDPPATLTSTNASSCETGNPYRQDFTSVGGVAPYTWSLIYGALPNGLTLNAQSGEITGVPTVAGTFVFDMQVTDALGMKASRWWTLIVTPPTTPTSVTEDFETGDLSHLPWVTSGDGAWSVTNANPLGGLYSAEAPVALNDSQSAAVEVAKECVDGTVSFWYSVSSEANYDYLQFYIDGVLKGQWSGTVSWNQASYQVPAGNHVFRWVYAKDSSVSAGSDTVWIDDIALPVATTPPPATFQDDFETGNLTRLPWSTGGDGVWSVVTANPHAGLYAVEASTAIVDNQSSTLEVTLDCPAGNISFWYSVSSEPNFDYLRFYIDGVEQAKWSGSIPWSQVTFPVSAGTHTFRWVYSKDGSVSTDSDTAWIDDVIVQPSASNPPSEATEDFETGNLAKLPWTTDGDGAWTAQTTRAHGGTYAAEAPAAINDFQSATLRVTLDCKAGDASFWYSVSSESNYDYLKFYIDDVLQGQWSGEVPWTQASYGVTAGTHTFKWVYSKDGSVSAGLDTAWVDDIVIPLAVSAPIVTITSPASGITNNTRPLLTYTASSGTVVVKVDGVAVNKVSGDTLDPLSDGVHTVRAEATDAANNTGYAEVTFTVDTVPPVVGINPVTSPTNISSQNITGTRESNATISVVVDTAAIAGTITYPTDTTWNCAISGLAEGANNVAVTATDAAANSATALTTITLDTVVPTVSISSPTAGISNNNRPVLTYTVSGGDVAVRVDGAFISKASGDTLDALADGAHTVRVESTDAAGNSSFAKVTFVVDTTPPTALATAQIAAGADYSITLKTDGTIWSSGLNNDGELGDGTTAWRLSPVQSGTDDTWISIASGQHHSVGIKTDGTLWMWGYNIHGQLGDGTTSSRLVPFQVGTENSWTSVAGGYAHTVALKADGSLWTWGYNNHGQLGDGTLIDKSTPIKIGADSTWKSIAAGFYHSLAIRTDGSLWAWGYYGTNGTNVDKLSPVQIGADNNWISVAAGFYHSLAMKSDGTLWTWGYNNDGQLGDGTTTSRLLPVQVGTDSNWRSITGSYGFSVASKSDGTLWAWGNNSYGALGNGTTDRKLSPTQIGIDANWESISTGYFHTIATKTDGSLWAWGDNFYGQFGNGTRNGSTYPVQIRKAGKVAINDGAEFTDDQAVFINLAAVDENAVVEMQLSNDGISWNVPEPYAAAKNWILSPGDGTKTVSVKFKDIAGNWSNAFKDTIVLDSTAPTVTIISPTTGVTNVNLPLLSYAVSDSTVIVKVDGIVVSKVSGDTLDALADGTHTVRVEATDAAGNAGFAEVTFTVDTTQPSVGIDPITTPTKSTTQTIAGTRESNATISVTADTVVTVGIMNYPTTTTWSCTISGLVEGANNITVTATDVAANNSMATTTITLDTIAPTVSITAPVPGLTNSRTPVLTYSSTEGTPVVTLDGVVITKASGDTLGSLVDGPHTVRVEAVDAAGNSSSAEVGFIVDATAPTVAIISPAAGLSNNRTPILSFTVSEGTAVVTVDGTVVPLISGDTLGPLADGLHTVRVDATDAAGNSAFAERTIIVDTIPPAITIDQLTVLTRESSQTVNGTREAGALVTVSVSTTATVGMVAYPTDTTWSCAITGLVEGANSVTATAHDGAGNSTTSSTIITLDTIAPTVTITAPLPGLTNSRTPVLTYSCTEGTSVVTLDGIVITKASGDTLGPLADGPHTVRVEATDGAGNSAFAEVSFTVDATAPTVTINSPTAGLSNNRTPLLSFAVSEGAAVVTVDGTVVSLISGDSLGPLADGPHTVRVDATDAAGNSAFAEMSFTVDATAPTVTIASPTAGLTNNNKPLLNYTASDGTVIVKVDGVIVNKVSGDPLDTLGDGLHVVRVEATDAVNNSGFAEVSFTIDTVPPAVSIISPAAGITNNSTPVLNYTVSDGTAVVKVDGVVVTKLSGDLLDALADGTHTVRVESVDAAGNAGFAESTIVVDTIPPAVTIDQPTVLTRESSQTVNGTREAGALVTVSVSTTATVGMVAYPTDTTWSCAITGLAEGVNAVAATAHDGAGNSTTSSTTITLDTIAPTVTITSPVPGLTNSRTPVLTYSSTEGTPVVTLDGVVIIKVSGDTLGPLADGPHTVRVEATDAAGNSSSAEVGFTVDATAPTVAITSPTAGLSNNRTPILSFTVSEGTAVVTFDGTVVPLIPGDTLGSLADGLHTVRVDATDAAGNSAFAEMSFTVDATAPTITITSPIAELTRNNSPVLTYSASDGVVVVKVDGAVVEKTSGDTLGPMADGLHTILVEATDVAGNTGFVEVSFTVDTAPPNVSISSPVSGISNNKNPTLTYTISDGTVVTKLDGAVINKVSGDTLDALTDGTHTVRVEATDAAGNTGFAEVNFTIDTVAPIVTIASPLAGITPDNTPLLSYTVNDGTVTVKVDGQPVSKVSGNSLDALSNGSHTVLVESTDSAGNTGFASVTFTVNYAPLTVTTTALPWGTTGVDYDQTLTASGGVPPYTWSVSGGALPSGVSLNPVNGTTAGMPTTAGSFTFTLQVTDADGAMATRSLSINIYDPVVVNTTSMADGFVGATYNQTLEAIGGLAPYTWSISSGSLPVGLSLNSATGEIYGTPAATGTSTFTVQIQDVNLTTASKTFSITINSARPDLIVTTVSGPTTGTKGTKIGVSATVKNQGQATASNSTLSIYLSIDGNITTSDIKLGDKSINSLAAGNSQSVNLNVTVPTSTAPGTYYIGAIADQTAVVAETNEDNNGKAGNVITIN